MIQPVTTPLRTEYVGAQDIIYAERQRKMFQYFFGNQHFFPFLYPQSNFSSSPSSWKLCLRFYLAFSVRIDKSRRLLQLSLACYIAGLKLPRSCNFPRTALNLSISSLPKCYWASPGYRWITGLKCNALLLLRTDSCVILSLIWWKQNNLFIWAMRDNFYFRYHPI